MRALLSFETSRAAGPKTGCRPQEELDRDEYLRCPKCGFVIVSGGGMLGFIHEGDFRCTCVRENF